MNSADFKEFMVSLGLVASVFDESLSEIKLRAYWLVLGGYDKEGFKSACKDILANRKFSKFPLPADFVEAMEGDINSKALKALESLEYAIVRFGQYKSVAFKDRTIMRCVKLLGGWLKICTMSDEDYKWAKKEFLKTYGALAKEPCSITHLSGITEQENRLGENGLKYESIGLIGFNQSEANLLSFLQVTEQNIIKHEKFLKLVKKAAV